MISFLLSIPAIIRVFIVFSVILFAIRMKLSLGNAFLVGSISLGLLFGMRPMPLAGTMVDSVIDPKTASLAIIVSLILILSNSLEKAGQMRRLLENFKGLVKNPRINLVVFPALIGLLPMPGGAIFSAPMVKDLGKDFQLSRAKLSYVNYWFRHVWEYCWPLYPGILLVTILADISIVSFILYMVPITISAIIFGYLPLWRETRPVGTETESSEKHPIGPFFRELTPILIVIIPGLLLGMLLSVIFPDLSISKELGLHIALLLGILWVWISNRFSIREVIKLLSSFQILTMIYMVATILIFKGILEQSNAAYLISRELLEANVPLILITMILPCLIGIVSGYTLAFVGVSMPILIPLMQSYQVTEYTFPYIMLVMVFGFVGVLLSPLHLCYILSNQYFETSMAKVYRHLWLPCGMILLLGMFYFVGSISVLNLAAK